MKIEKELAEINKTMKEILREIKNLNGKINPVDTQTEEELYDKAKKLVIENQKASATFIQRKLLVGYARAARILDMLENKGIISPAIGEKPRKVLKK